MSKRLRTSIFLVLGVLILIFLMAGCVESPAEKTPDETPDAKVGKLYTLQEALELSLLTLDDIRQIADYHNNNLAPAIPLDDEIALKIREARLAEVRAMTHSDGTPQFPNANIDDISIREYCGEYNGSYVVLISTGLYAVADVSSTHIFGDGIRIHYGSPNYIRVWTEKVF